VTPLLSVVITAYERSDAARAAVRSILEFAGGTAIEVVVVDDGSGEQVAAALDELADDTVRVVHQHNAGLGAARVRGASECTGRWLAVLDDDDRWLAGWAELLDRLDVEGVGIVTGGARLVDPSGRHLRDEPPRPLGPIFGEVTAQYLAGCFAVRRDVYDLAGGYLPGLCSSHQTELFIRCCAVTAELGLAVEHVGVPVAEIERRADTDRSLSNPQLLFDGTRWILARHAERFALDPTERSNWEAVASLNGRRVGDPTARVHAWRAARLRPTVWRNWLRLAAMSSPLAARRWGRAGDYSRVADPQQRPLAHAVSMRHTAHAALTSDDELLFLPWRYRANPPASADADGTPFWDEAQHNDVRYQDPVYRWGAKLVGQGRRRVIDVGCGSGVKLVGRIAPRTPDWLGVDQDSAIRLASSAHPDGNWLAADLGRATTWSSLAERPADLVICADVIEHLEDPHELLVRLRSLLAPGGVLLLSTPDRGRLERIEPLGPPRNPRHIREWTADELALLAQSAGLRVVRTRHLLPRAYSPTVAELRRTVGRGLRRWAVPDRRSSLAMLLESDGSVPTGPG
jgi:glycosyltransferase involved in cell wall biosynthesis/SAM-dependent methyltransferase